MLSHAVRAEHTQFGVELQLFFPRFFHDHACHRPRFGPVVSTGFTSTGLYAMMCECPGDAAIDVPL